MNYKKISSANNIKYNLIMGLLGLLFTVFIIAMLPKIVNADTTSTDPNLKSKNIFYVQILNYSMPIVQVTSFEDETLAEEKVSIKDKLLDMIGINAKNPSVIISREVSLINSEEFMKDAVENTVKTDLTPFVLNNNEISKETANTPTGDSTSTLPAVDPSLVSTLNTSKPQVLIYHSHTREGYITNINEYTEVVSQEKEISTSDASKNVCAVGDVLAQELQNKYGISVIHDKTMHDAMDYNKSYQRSGQTVDKYLKQYGDFKLIIDLHRDSTENRNAVTTKIDNQNVAKFMFVMANKNPHFNKNMEAVNKISAISKKLYPNFMLNPYFYGYGTQYFNQAKSNNAVLIEVGSQVNTLDEAKNSGEYLARIIAEYINGKN